MISPDLLHTAAALLKRAGLPNAPSAAAVLALHLAALPPEPEPWGDGEPMTSKDHLYAEIVAACRMLKTIGWALDPMAVAALAAESAVRKHEDWQMQGRCEARIYTWITEMDRTPRHPSAEDLRDLAGLATAATEPDDGAALVVHTHECYTRHAMAERWECFCSGVMAAYSNTDETPDPALQAATARHDDDVDPMTPILDEVERVAGEAPPLVVEVPPEHAMSLSIGGRRIEGFGDDAPITRDFDAERARPGGAFDGSPESAEAIARAETLRIAGSSAAHSGEWFGQIEMRPEPGPEWRLPIARTEPAGVPFEVTAPEADQPKPKKPRCGLVYSQLESHPPIDVPCGRPVNHKGACGPAKVVGKKA